VELSGQQQKVEEQLRFLAAICIAFVISIALFVFLAWFVTEGSGSVEPLAGATSTVFVAVGVIVGVGLLLAAPVVQRRLLERSDPPAPDGDITPVLENYRVAVYLAFLLREGAALSGLMLALLTGDATWAYVLAAAAVVAMFWGWPRRDDLAAVPV